MKDFNCLCWMSLLLMSASLVSGQATDEEKKEFNATFKDLIVANDLKEDNSFRCGIFFAGDNFGDKPRDTVFIIPKRFEADCSTADGESFKKFCYDLFNKFLKFMSWKSTSRRRGEPYKVGDDVCWVLKQTKLKNPPPNKRFPNGITVGFYYNYCTDSSWYDTELRVSPNICCKEKDGEDVWLYQDCP